MKLQQMRIKNFRQFYGEQQIIFAQDNENITIIFGENGKGKTGIFRALMYCLFGSTHLQQDDPKETIHLVNLLKLEEQLGLPVEALVEVEFEHKGKQYTLSRSLKGLKRDSKIQEKTGLVSLTIAYDGNVLKVTKDELEVSQEINNIIDDDDIISKTIPNVFTIIIILLALTGPILSLITPITNFEITFPTIPAERSVAPNAVL